MANNRFGDTLSRAKKLIDMQKNGTFEKTVENVTKSGKVNSSILDENYDPLASVMAQPSQYSDLSQMTQETIARKGKTSKLPKAILESMIQNPINTSVDGFGDSMGGSVLDALGIDSEQINNNYDGVNDIITETNSTPRQQCTQPQYSMPTQTIDYSLIKMIIEDAVKKNIASLKKTIINESAKSGSADENVKVLKLANNKLQFLTNDGDLYEAKLEFKKNVRNK